MQERGQKRKEHCTNLMRVVTSVELIFFFQAEDGIRDVAVTGVQTCALPISKAECARFGLWGARPRRPCCLPRIPKNLLRFPVLACCGISIPLRKRLSRLHDEIGRASCRERV